MVPKLSLNLDIQSPSFYIQSKIESEVVSFLRGCFVMLIFLWIEVFLSNCSDKPYQSPLSSSTVFNL